MICDDVPIIYFNLLDARNCASDVSICANSLQIFVARGQLVSTVLEAQLFSNRLASLLNRSLVRVIVAVKGCEDEEDEG